MGRQPLAFFAKHLQTADFVLVKQCQTAVIGMRRNTKLFLTQLRRLWWIINQRATRYWFVDTAHKIVFGDIQTQRKCPQQALAAGLRCAEISVEHTAHFRQIIRPVIGMHHRLSGL